MANQCPGPASGLVREEFRGLWTPPEIGEGLKKLQMVKEGVGTECWRVCWTEQNDSLCSGPKMPWLPVGFRVGIFHSTRAIVFKWPFSSVRGQRNYLVRGF